MYACISLKSFLAVATFSKPPKNINISRPCNIGSIFVSLNPMFISFKFTNTITFSKTAFNTMHYYFIQGWAGHLIKPAKNGPLVIPTNILAFIPN